MRKVWAIVLILALFSVIGFMAKSNLNVVDEDKVDNSKIQPFRIFQPSNINGFWDWFDAVIDASLFFVWLPIVGLGIWALFISKS